MPFGIVVGGFLLARIAIPSVRMRLMGWLAVLSCVPLIGSAWNPPLWLVLLLRAILVVAQAIGAPLAAGLIGLAAVAMLAVSWAQLRVSAAQARQAEVAGA
jgi:hypothetical protein